MTSRTEYNREPERFEIWGNTVQEFSITTSLVENKAYLAGSRVDGNVIIHLDNPEAITGHIRIVLSGQARVWRGSAQPQTDYINGRRITDRGARSDEQTIFHDMTAYLCSQMLASGRHQFPYAFQLPDNIPSSYHDSNGHIRYTLTVTMPTSKCDITRQKVIFVAGIVKYNTPELIRQVFGSYSKRISKGSFEDLKLSVELDKGGYACGDAISLRARAIYGYTGVRKAANFQAFLKRNVTYLFRETGETKVNNKIIGYFNFVFCTSRSEIKGYFSIPNIVLSTSCDVLKVSYFVVVIGELLSRNDPHTVSLPITIGNRRTSSQDCNPPANLSHSNATVTSNSLQGTNRNMQPRIIYSASPLPSSSVDMRPVSSTDNIEVPNSPPPPYSEY